MKKVKKLTVPIRSPRAMPLSEDVQKCHQVYGNVYHMVVMASERSRDLARGAEPLVDNKKHKPCVTALLEIADGKVDKNYLKNK
jgi:DNA-directed RNA polymerase subunit omega